MLIKEIINNTAYPLIEADLLKDKQKVNHNNVAYEWDDTNQVFVATMDGAKTEIEQGSRLEYEVLKSAGVIRSGGKLHPTLLTRFKGAFNKGPLGKKQAPGFLGKLGQDMDSQTGIGRKFGAGIGSAIGQGIDKMMGTPTETYPKGFSMHFISKKGDPVDVSLEQSYTDADFKKMAKKKELVKVRTVDSNRVFGVSVEKLQKAFATPDSLQNKHNNKNKSGWDKPNKKANTNKQPDQPNKFNNSQDNLDPNIDYDTPPNLR